MITVAILTISDSAATGTREDLSGPAVRQVCEGLHWFVTEHKTVPDEEDAIAETIAAWADGGSIALILTSGGTGIAPRDVTPEATRRVIHRELQGLPELMRREGMEQTPFSVLSRAVAGTRAKSLVVNLPGSPKGAVQSLAAIAKLVPHVVDLLQGRTEH